MGWKKNQNLNFKTGLGGMGKRTCVSHFLMSPKFIEEGRQDIPNNSCPPVLQVCEFNAFLTSEASGTPLILMTQTSSVTHNLHTSLVWYGPSYPVNTAWFFQIMKPISAVSGPGTWKDCIAEFWEITYSIFHFLQVSAPLSGCNCRSRCVEEPNRTLSPDC